jgi:hypothetical protein
MMLRSQPPSSQQLSMEHPPEQPRHHKQNRLQLSRQQQLPMMGVQPRRVPNPFARHGRLLPLLSQPNSGLQAAPSLQPSMQQASPGCAVGEHTAAAAAAAAPGIVTTTAQISLVGGDIAGGVAAAARNAAGGGKTGDTAVATADPRLTREGRGIVRRKSAIAAGQPVDHTTSR